MERNDGVDAQVRPGTLFYFTEQDGAYISAYGGGAVAEGYIRLTVVDSVGKWAYRQRTIDGTWYSGSGRVQIGRREDGRLEVRDEWAWDDGHGKGRTLLVEVRPDDSLLNGKVLVVERNDDADAHVGPGTRFAFRQVGNQIEALYYGGRVRFGFMTGQIHGEEMTWSYTQIADDGLSYSGVSNGKVRRRVNGRLELKDDWSDGRSKGSCVMVEVTA